MDIQRLRNLTTRRLHTSMEHIYEDLGFIVGDDGLMTHIPPRCMEAIQPLRRFRMTGSRAGLRIPALYASSGKPSMGKRG